MTLGKSLAQVGIRTKVKWGLTLLVFDVQVGSIGCQETSYRCTGLLVSPRGTQPHQELKNTKPQHDKTNKVDLSFQQRLRSASASTQYDQSLCCPPEETLGPKLPMTCTAKTLIRLGGCHVPCRANLVTLWRSKCCISFHLRIEKSHFILQPCSFTSYTTIKLLTQSIYDQTCSPTFMQDHKWLSNNGSFRTFHQHFSHLGS